jgi:membrane-associated phospholipid phosphatase
MRASDGVRAQATSAVMARAATILENVRGGLAVVVRPPRATVAKLVPVWRRLRARGAIVVAVVALSMWLLDAPARDFAAALPPGLVDIAYEVTDFGRSGWILVPVGALMIMVALLASPALDHMSRAVLAMLAARFGYVFVAVGLPGLVGTVVKRWIGRVRPSDNGPFAYEPLSWRSEYASFPSGHATTAFAALVAFGLIFPRARPVLWVYALFIAASRVMVSAHYSSDVIAGAAFGAFGALWVCDWFAARRLGFYVGSDGLAHPMPGPSWRRIKRVAGNLFAP